MPLLPNGEKTLLFFSMVPVQGFGNTVTGLQFLSAGTAKFTIRLYFLPALRAVFLRNKRGPAFTAEFSLLLIQFSAVRTFDTNHFLDNRLLRLCSSGIHLLGKGKSCAKSCNTSALLHPALPETAATAGNSAYFH